MKKRLCILLAAVLCAGLCACSAGETEQADEASASPAALADSLAAFPAFSTTDLAGNTVTNDIFAQADLTVVNFWGTFCGPCIEEMPALAAWESEMADNVQLVGIIVDAPSTDSDQYALAQQIVQQAGVEYANLIEAGQFDAILSGLVGVPTTIFVDRDGNMVGEPIIGAYVDGYKQFVQDYLDA